MRRTVLLAIMTLSLATAAHAQTTWTYIAGHVSPMTDIRTDYLTLRSSQPFKDHIGNLVFANLIVECSAGGPHPVRFTSEAHLDTNLTAQTQINLRFGDDKPTGFLTLPVERDGASLILPSANDATALRLASYDRLRLQIQVHSQPDQFLEFAVSGLRNVAESHGCPLPAN